mgnify:CR=1 FL=1
MLQYTSMDLSNNSTPMPDNWYRFGDYDDEESDEIVIEDDCDDVDYDEPDM